MNGIEKITATNTHGESLLSNHDNNPTVWNNSKSTDVNTDKSPLDAEESGTKITLSSQTLEEIKKQQELKKQEIKKTDYTLEMSGIPLYGGRLVSVTKYPDGSEQIVDAITGQEILPQDLPPKR
ncbi:hypothetical protein [Enterobacter kobei]|uniref:hypothetical protein n=1 Tax=Enterobacter kobei TaxID=208224 RepID=UPI003A969B6B